jgi:NADH dehydrogenase
VTHASHAAEPQRQHVVIIGAGFAGLACAQELGNSPLRVTLIDRNNYHLFVPLLYQVATAALSPADIAQPIRRVLGRFDNVAVVLGDVVGVDAAARAVRLADGQAIGYDRLVIATGSRDSYFGHEEWRPHAPALRTLKGARAIRTRILLAFEQAELAACDAEREALMTTVIVGGGPTGVELAGAVAELARFALARDFRRIDPRRARILLIEAGPRLLSAFPPDLASYAERMLGRLGVTVLTGRKVDSIEAQSLRLSGEVLRAGVILWAAGIRASPAGEWLGAEVDRAGRIRVGPDLRVAGLNDVYAIGDTALAQDESGAPLPGLAQVAKQQGVYLGRALLAELRDGKLAPPFRFKDRGNTAIIGRNAAVFDFGRHRLKGRLAWLLWVVVHVYLLVGFDKRLLVSMQWLWRYLTYERGARLILPDG